VFKPNDAAFHLYPQGTIGAAFHLALIPENAALFCIFLSFLADILSHPPLFSTTSRDRPSFFIFGDVSSPFRRDFLAECGTGKDRNRAAGREFISTLAAALFPS
jgi:hypothetical protein